MPFWRLSDSNTRTSWLENLNTVAWVQSRPLCSLRLVAIMLRLLNAENQDSVALATQRLHVIRDDRPILC